MAMDLNDLLLQQQEIRNLLSNLQEAHEKILLSNENENDNLNKLRKDILICLNDLKTANLLIIDPRDGLIKKNLRKLDKYEERMKLLDSEAASLKSELNLWHADQSPTAVPTAETWGSVPINLVGNHRSLLDSYIDVVGIENTTLADNSDELDHNSNSSRLTREQLLDNVQRLKLCQEQVNSELDQLRSLISQYERDRSVINDEYTKNTELIEKEVNSLLREEDKITSQREKILIKLGLLKDNEHNQQRTTFFSMKAFKVDNSDYEVALSQAYQFIDAKKQALKQILHENKSQTQSLERSFSIWNDVTRSIQALETNLQQTFIQKEGNVSKNDIVAMINSTLIHVRSIVGTYSKDIALKSITCEQKALQKALEQIDGQLQPIPINTQTKAQEILQIGTSPPKVGLSKEFASNFPVSSDGLPLKVKKND
ncbi:unnamed protein product [Kluyveromyces dobzhanskii CBS 2104]|uniref:WGS project CCBQ000000000 data, contig 00016 n=1 Tax=Kluyveromyces dobzhanskii CBS 2104 TaxID=1427455 RepID=A0A0A8KZW0_9SACH|nr:unnamed protein product [Kluyveromyces dobzhanskii CBS 2104]